MTRLWRAMGAVGPIDAISVTGPRGSFGVADGAGVPRSAMLTWQDRRAGRILPGLLAAAGPDDGSIIGYPMTASAVLPKLLWLQQTEPGDGSPPTGGSSPHRVM